MDFRYNDNLGFWLYRAQRYVGYAFAEVLRTCCLEHGKPYIVTPPQWGVLAALQEGDGLTIGTLNQLLGHDAPTMTGIVKRLEQNGLVERRHDSEDRRVVKVFLTAEGRDILQFLPNTARTFLGILTRGLTADEQRDLLTKLWRIMANVSAIAPDYAALLPEGFGQEAL
jgi:DNA-binding MarR family transcriptional regulator